MKSTKDVNFIASAAMNLIPSVNKPSLTATRNFTAANYNRKAKRITTNNVVNYDGNVH